MTKSPPLTTFVTLGALVTLVLLSLAAVVFVSGDDALQRLGLFFAVAGTSVASIAALVRSDVSAKRLENGELDERLDAAIRRTNSKRRFSDPDE